MGARVQQAVFFQIFAADSVETVNVHEIVLKSIRLSRNEVVHVVCWAVRGEFSLASRELKVVLVILNT